tara:strand:- start:15553 stop:16461 length:909 start_codon:yes stop_codon:yes gene_type:complete
LKNNKVILISKEESDIRIDRWLKKKFSLTQNFIENNLRKGNIKVNRKKTKSNYRLLYKDKLYIFNFSNIILINNNKIITKKIPKHLISKFKKSILFDSQNFLILNKWEGISTQGGKKTGISINDLIKKISSDYNLVHRLDKDTTGLLIVSKNYQTTKIFGKLFKENQINKKYLAICDGIPKNKSSTVKLNLKNKKNNSYESITKYKILKIYDKKTLIVFTPITGRTHQLRIVSKYLNCPIMGDIKYNSAKNKFKYKLMLNAYSLNFKIHGKKYEYFSNLPYYMKNILNKMNISEKNIMIKNY